MYVKFVTLPERFKVVDVNEIIEDVNMKISTI